MHPHAPARLRKHHPLPLDTSSSTQIFKNKIEMKRRNITFAPVLLILLLTVQSCRAIKESESLTHQKRIGIDSCLITHDLTDVIKKSDITISCVHKPTQSAGIRSKLYVSLALILLLLALFWVLYRRCRRFI